MKVQVRTALAILLAAAALAACNRETAQDTAPATGTPEELAQSRAEWPAGVEAQIDSGNAAYSAQQFDAASAHYRRAAELGPKVPAAWFGIYMAEHAKGNTAAADSALERSRQLAPGATRLDTLPHDTIGH